MSRLPALFSIPTNNRKLAAGQCSVPAARLRGLRTAARTRLSTGQFEIRRSHDPFH